MIKNIDAAWKTRLASNALADFRTYLDPRGIEYPPIGGVENTYVMNTTATDLHGDVHISDGASYRLMRFNTPITLEVFTKPSFAYDTADTPAFATFYTNDGYNESYFTWFYYAATDKFGVTVYNKPGGSAATSTTVVLAHQYISNAELQVYHRLTCTVSGSTITLYHNGTNAVTGTYANFATMLKPVHFYPINTTGAAATRINYITIYPGYAASAAEVLSRFKNVYYERIHFDFQINGVGRSSCDISRYIKGFSIENRDGYTAGTASFSIQSLSGEFCDDQYAAFAPESGSYNGTSAQKYLANNMRIHIDTIGATEDQYETMHVGTIKSGTFTRSAAWNDLSMISASSEDAIATISNRIIKNMRKYEDYSLDELLIEYISLASRREIYNYIGNSGFELATISNMWVVAGTAAVFERDSGTHLAGSYCGYLHGTDTLNISARINIDLNVGEVFTWQVWVFWTTASPFTVTMGLEEYTGVTQNGITLTNVTHPGTGWYLCSVTHTIVDSDSTSLRISALTGTTPALFDMAMVTYGQVKNYYIENSNDGTSGSISSSLATLGTYETVGVNADAVTYHHPWAVLKKDDNVWEHIKDVLDAYLCRIFHVTPCGYIKCRSNFTSLLETVSRGDIPNIYALQSQPQDLIANKIKVSGVIIEQDPVETQVWDALSAGYGNESTDSKLFSVSMAAGETFPKAADSTDPLECIYGIQEKDKRRLDQDNDPTM